MRFDLTVFSLDITNPFTRSFTRSTTQIEIDGPVTTVHSEVSTIEIDILGNVRLEYGQFIRQIIFADGFVLVTEFESEPLVLLTTLAELVLWAELAAMEAEFEAYAVDDEGLDFEDDEVDFPDGWDAFPDDLDEDDDAALSYR